MPELPEVETVCRGLRGFLPQHPLAEVTVRRRDLRVPIPPDFEQRLLGRTVLRVERRAKYILWYLDSDDVVLVHLGMSGRLSGYRHGDPKRPQAAAKHDHVWLRTDDDTLICFCDPRRFGLFTVCHSSQLAGHPLLKDLGIAVDAAVSARPPFGPARARQSGAAQPSGGRRHRQHLRQRDPPPRPHLARAVRQ